jgi:hypothetical protein
VALPIHVRVRRRDDTNACKPPPSAYDSSIYDDKEVDWDYHLELYLTVMSKLAEKLGKVFEYSLSSSSSSSSSSSYTASKGEKERETSGKNVPPPIDKYKLDIDDDTDFTASPLLFPSSRPRWNVEILRGSYYDLQPIKNDDVVTATKYGDDDVEEEDRTVEGVSPFPPLPIVEFLQETSKTSGHVLIRLQGTPRNNPHFDTRQRRPQPVTLVFDAGFYQNPASALQNF